MKENINWSYNPNYSDLVNKGERTGCDNNGVFENRDGEKFVEIFKKNKYQIFTSRVLKGIIPVSDVVEKDGKFYSKIFNIQGISEKETEDAINDQIFLEVIFFDYDHYINDEHNVNIDQKRYDKIKAVFYDFDRVDLKSEKPIWFKPELIKFLKKEYQLNKLLMLEDRLLDFEFMKKMVDKHFTENQLLSMIKILLDRIEEFREKIDFFIKNGYEILRQDGMDRNEAWGTEF